VELSEPFLHPMLFSFRSLDPLTCIYPLTALKLSGVSLPIGKTTCRQYAMERGTQLVTLWLDPAAQFVMRRCTEQINNKLLYQIDVQYAANATCGHVPTSWTVQFYDKEGNLERTTRIEVVSMRIGEPVSADQFDLEFPPRTQVFDARNSKEYIVQSDGSMAEASPTGNLVGPSISQPGTPFIRRHKWLLTAVIVALLAVLVLAIIRGKRGRLFT
jgi:hypothetical protein